MQKDKKLFYIDSSIILSRLLRETQSLVVSDFKNTILITSELTELECRRTLDRIRLVERLSDEETSNKIEEFSLVLESLNIVAISKPILRRAKASFPTVVRSLDSIHLASAEMSGCTNFLTYDKQQGFAAKAIGMAVNPTP